MRMIGVLKVFVEVSCRSSSSVLTPAILIQNLYFNKCTLLIHI